jgi:hypothetical protein
VQSVVSADVSVASPCYLLHAGFLLGLIFDPNNEGGMFLSKRRLTFNGLHGIISKNVVLFIVYIPVYHFVTSLVSCLTTQPIARLHSVDWLMNWKDLEGIGH